MWGTMYALFQQKKIGTSNILPHFLQEIMFRYTQLLKSNKFDLSLWQKSQYIVHGCIFIKISDSEVHLYTSG